jgi:hypothetical protein
MSITPAPYCIPYVVTASVPRMKWIELIWDAAMFRIELRSPYDCPSRKTVA